MLPVPTLILNSLMMRILANRLGVRLQNGSGSVVTTGIQNPIGKDIQKYMVSAMSFGKIHNV